MAKYGKVPVISVFEAEALQVAIRHLERSGFQLCILFKDIPGGL